MRACRFGFPSRRSRRPGAAVSRAAALRAGAARLPGAARWLSAALLGSLVLALGAGSARAEPFDHPRIDGVIAHSADDWAAADRVVNDRADDNSVRTGNVRYLYVTWDADSLYVGLTYQAINFGLSVYCDLGRSVGVANAALLDTFANRFTMPAGRQIDLLLANRFGGYPTSLQPQVRLVRSAGGATENISTRARRAQTAGVPPSTTAKARFPFYYFHEAAIPWEAIYGLGPGRVPPHAVLRAVAVITGSDPAANGVDSAPDNPGLDGGAGSVALANFHLSVLDANGDGLPDPAGASVSGGVTLPDNPGNLPLTVTATLRDWAGGALGAPLVTTVTAAGAAAYTVPRLPAGSYDVTVAAAGYVPGTQSVTLAENEQRTGLDFTLARATAVRGSVAFLSGPGAAGTVTLYDANGARVSSAPFPAAGGPFTLYAQASGQYRVEAVAPTYVAADTSFAVTAGVDVDGLALSLPRQTEVSGTVGFAAGAGSQGRLYFTTSGPDSSVLDETDFLAGGSPFQFFTDASGTYHLRAVPTVPLPSLYLEADTLLTVTRGQDQAGVPVVLRLKPRVRGSVRFVEGPGAAGEITVSNAATGVAVDTLAFSAAGGTYGPVYLRPGSFRFNYAAPGYLPADTTITIAAGEELDLGPRRLTAVRATRLVLTDLDGRPVPSVEATVSIPDSNLYFYAPVRLEARDDAGRRDLYDVDGRLAGPFALSALKADDVSFPRGRVRFSALADTGQVIESVTFAGGEAAFQVRNTAVEILRVYARGGAPGAPAARVTVGFGDPLPATIVLTAARDTLVANDVDEIQVTAQLYDSAKNLSRLADVPIGFAVSADSEGRGAFRVPTVLTNAAGRATAVLTATGAGALAITAGATAGGRVLATRANDLTGPETLALTAVPGPPAGWRLSLAASATGLTDPVTLTARLVDAFDNPVARAGATIAFQADPPGLGSFQPALGTADENGEVRTQYRPAGAAGTVFLSGSSALYPANTAALRIVDALIELDPPYGQEPAGHRTFAATDLTAVVVDNDAQDLIVDVPFVSDWSGLQLHLLIETGFDAAGAASDPFVMPVNYGHAERPDYALTTKYSANDYGDFRKWAGGGWQFWVPSTGQYTTDESAPKSIQNLWTAKTPAGMTIRVPWAPLGGVPDSLRVQVYLTQEEQGGPKRSAFDSVPSDSTLNLNFALPGTAEEWQRTTQPVTLRHWSRTYRPKTDFPPAPIVSEAAVTPATLAGGEAFTLRARVTDAGGGVGDVLADLSQIAGPSLARLYDDGLPAHGDAAAGDGLYGLLATVPLRSPGGELPLVVTAYSAGNATASADTALVAVSAAVEVIVHADDPVGDDHGPNHPAEEKKYYTYPTNSAFVPGAFDLTSLDVYETVAVVGGQPVEMIAFRVGIVDFPNPSDPGRANWNPQNANINIQKIDILIDSGPGGATSGLPDRNADFQPWDAWDYAVVIDGWYKGVIPSLGLNTAQSWRQNARRDDASITILSDWDDDTITALVSKEALGNPTPDKIRNWDICVLMAGHDTGYPTEEEKLGGVRWVEESRSEWRFGGGVSGSDGNKDANVIDLILIPGVDRAPGRPQEFVLDHGSPQAIARREARLTPCAIEMSTFEDTGPPVVGLTAGAADMIEQEPLAGASLSFLVPISDDYQVAEAQFRYRPTNYAGAGWAVAETMGFEGADLWNVDLLPEWIAANLAASPVDGARFLEFQIVARDALDKVTTSPVLTMRIAPAADCLGLTAPLTGEELTVRHADGTRLRASAAWVGALAASAAGEAWTGPELAVDTTSLHLRMCVVPEAVAAAPTVPAGRGLGVYRDLSVVRLERDAPPQRLDRWPGPVDISLHYPQAWVPEGMDEARIGLYEYLARANRWVLVGGHVNDSGNVVTAQLNHAGTFGLFWTEGLAQDAGEVVSGITVSPNPFSPNGDGLYDETTISFYLSQEATVTAEIYSSEGRRHRVITQTMPYSGEDDPSRAPRRIAGLVWDGRDGSGNLVPYGLYILRLSVTFKQAAGERTIRSTHPVAVIR